MISPFLAPAGRHVQKQITAASQPQPSVKDCDGPPVPA